MNIIVRFYWQYDLDLIALAMHPDFEIGRWMKKAVIAYAKGDTDFIIPLPRPQPYRVELDNCKTHFVLSPGKQDDVIQFLCGFRYGFRNSALKQIFRYYLERPNMEVFFNEKMYATKVRGVKRAFSKTPKAASAQETEQVTEKAMEMPAKAPDDTPEEPISDTSAIAAQAPVIPTLKPTSIPDAAKPPAKKATPPKEEEKSFNLFSAVDKLL